MENLQGGILALQHSYHIHRRIGPRAFVTLYEATQEPFSRPVLVAVYDRAHEAGATGELFATIKARAEVAGSLDADGILRTVDYGELDQGVPFVIGEFLEEVTTLQAILDDQGTLAPEKVLELVEAVAPVLEEAHGQGIFHGSLCPEWIFSPSETSLDQVFLGHFNLGLTFQEILDLPNAVLKTDAMSPMPPEVFSLRRGADEENAPRTFNATDDLYALAAIAYQALVGVHPYFDDPTDASEGLLRIKSEDAPELSALGIESDLSDVIARALAREPQKRYPNPTAFARALRSAIAPEPAPAQTITPAPATTPTPATTPSPPREGMPGPAPGGYAMTGALILLLLSNLIWFFSYLGQTPSTVEPSTLDQPLAVATRTLPGGLQIKTDPPGAEIFIVSADESTLVGTTPHVVSDILSDRDDAVIKLEKAGFLEQRLTLEHGPGGSDLLIYLTPHDAPIK
ncbi:MAG: serine/threonine protein kinase [Bradymonadaceae bacterium]